MSIFDNLVDCYSNKTPQEWRKLILENIVNEHIETIRNGLWFTGPAADFVMDFVPERWQTVSAYKKWMKTQKRLAPEEMKVYEKVFSNIFNKYGVMFRYRIQYKPNGYIRGIVFEEV